MSTLINNANVEVLKVPLGFIKLIQAPLLIVALASVSMSVTTHYTATGVVGKCPQQTIKFGFPYELSKIQVSSNSCDPDAAKATLLTKPGDYDGAAHWYVLIGWASFIFVVCALVVYLFIWDKYETDKRLAIGDLVITALLALFWLIVAISWWGSSGGLAKNGNSLVVEDAVITVDKACKTSEPACKLDSGWGFSGPSVAVVAAWGCVLMFVGNCWFVYKETVWFRNRQPTFATGLPGQPPPPPAASGAGPYPYQ